MDMYIIENGLTNCQRTFWTVIVVYTQILDDTREKSWQFLYDDYIVELYARVNVSTYQTYYNHYDDQDAAISGNYFDEPLSSIYG